MRGASWSELGASWSELGASWSELGVSWEAGESGEQAQSKLEQGEQAGVSWE